MRSIAVALAVVCAWGPAATAEISRDRFVRVPTDVRREDVPLTLNSRTIFLNRCPMGCVLANGYTDSRTNKSKIAAGTLSAFKHGDDSWKQVVDCVKQTFAPFNVRVTDKDPGPNVEHFEIMVAGTPSQVGMSSFTLGVAEYSCTSPGSCLQYLPNTIVFDFANHPDYLSYAHPMQEICATAAQEIAHTWTLDHVTDKTDPMTYYTYDGQRMFKDGVKCGSDCQNGTSPFGLACTGSEHTCMSTGTSTQNDIQILLKLFGPSCMDSSACDIGYVCQEHACIAGPDVAGGLGATCAGDMDCLDGVCADDGDHMACATSCDLNADSCPAGFGCLDAGRNDGTGVCWAGLDDGGCCDTSGHSSGAGSMLLALGLAATFVTSRRRRNRK